MSVSLADIISDDARNPTPYSGYVADSESICISKSNKSVSYSQGFGTRGLYALSIGGLTLKLKGTFYYDKFSCN